MSAANDQERSVLARAARTPDANVARRLRSVLLPRRRHLAGVAYLVLDRSTSMGDPGKMDALRDGAWGFFVEAVRRSHAVGAVTFAHDARLLSGAGLDALRLWRRLQAVQPFGSTRMEAGLAMAASRLRFRTGTRTVVLLTDGEADDRAAALRAARTVRGMGIRLIAIGTGEADDAFLASLTGRSELARHVPRDGIAGALKHAAATLGPAPADVATDARSDKAKKDRS
ncbi:MAG: vWA domain-containing protein [Trueperaceae bacterium]